MICRQAEDERRNQRLPLASQGSQVSEGATELGRKVTGVAHRSALSYPGGRVGTASAVRGAFLQEVVSWLGVERASSVSLNTPGSSSFPGDWSHRHGP